MWYNTLPQGDAECLKIFPFDAHQIFIWCASTMRCDGGVQRDRPKNGSLGMRVGCFVAEAAEFASDSDCRRLPAISPCLCDSLALNLGGATIGNRPRLCNKPSNQTLKQSLPPWPIHILQYLDWEWVDPCLEGGEDHAAPFQSTYCNMWIGFGQTESSTIRRAIGSAGGM